MQADHIFAEKFVFKNAHKQVKSVMGRKCRGSQFCVYFSNAGDGNVLNKAHGSLILHCHQAAKALPGLKKSPLSHSLSLSVKGSCVSTADKPRG